MRKRRPMTLDIKVRQFIMCMCRKLELNNLGTKVTDGGGKFRSENAILAPLFKCKDKLVLQQLSTFLHDTVTFCYILRKLFESIIIILIGFLKVTYYHFIKWLLK